MQVRKRTFNLRALSIKRDLFFRKLCQISSHPMDLLDLWECCKCDLVRRCLQNSLCLCRGFANCGGSPGEESLPCSTNCCLMLGPACFWEEEVVSGSFLGGMAGIPQSSSNVVAGPADPCEDSIQGLSMLGAALQRECFIKTLFTLYSLCFSSDTAHGSQRIISWTLAW